MSNANSTLSELLTGKIPNADVSEAYGELTLVVPADQIASVCRTLRDDEQLGFEELIDVCGVDYLAYGEIEWETISATGSGFSRGVNRDDHPHYDRNDEFATSKRFAVVYHLLSVTHNWRLRVKVFLPDHDPRLESVVDIWSVANWFEREAFDLYGILFVGHPDLRRILTDYGFIGHPFRKDFPLIGHVEMRYDNEKQRVVYEPVSIEPRTLVPRVIRDDHRYLDTEKGDTRG